VQSYENTAAVLKAVRRMAAHELAAEPTVRAFVREVLAETMVVSTGELLTTTLYLEQ